MSGFRRDHFPVGIARGDVARERPDIGDVGDLFGVAVDHGAVAVARRGNQLRDEADGDLRRAFALLGRRDGLFPRYRGRAEVDGGVISSACLYELPVYDANPQAYKRKAIPQTNEPVPEGMFPDSIAGLPAMKNGCGPQISNDGRVNCAGGYGTVSRQLVAVYFERWPENTPKLKEWSHLDPTAKWSHLQDPDVNEEVRGGGKVCSCQFTIMRHSILRQFERQQTIHMVLSLGGCSHNDLRRVSRII